MNRTRWEFLRDSKRGRVYGKRNPPKRRVRASVPLGSFSGLKKLARLLRQGRVPDERMNIIKLAEKSAGVA